MGQTWKEFCASINKVANKAAVKIEELSDSATLHVKAKSLDVKLCEAYERLGRLYYEQLGGECGKAADIDREVGEIDRLKKELDEINAQIAQNKNKNGEQTASEETAGTAETTASTEDGAAQTDDPKTSGAPEEQAQQL